MLRGGLWAIACGMCVWVEGQPLLEQRHKMHKKDINTNCCGYAIYAHAHTHAHIYKPGTRPIRTPPEMHNELPHKLVNIGSTPIRIRYEYYPLRKFTECQIAAMLRPLVAPRALGQERERRSPKSRQRGQRIYWQHNNNNNNMNTKYTK